MFGWWLISLSGWRQPTQGMWCDLRSARAFRAFRAYRSLDQGCL